MKEDLVRLTEARKYLTNKIADMNWDYTNRSSKVKELNSQIEALDKIIIALSTPSPTSEGEGKL